MSKVFPASPVASYPFDLEQEWQTVVSPFDGGNEQRRRKIQFPRYNMTLNFDQLTVTDVATLWNFYKSCSGAYETIYYVLPWTETHLGMYVNTGNDVATTFDIPGLSTSSHTIYIDGAAQGAGFSILTGGGVAAADRVQFTVPPAAGQVVSVDFTGYFRNKCRFKHDNMSRRLFEVMLFRTGLEMKGLSGA